MSVRQVMEDVLIHVTILLVPITVHVIVDTMYPAMDTVVWVSVIINIEHSSSKLSSSKLNEIEFCHPFIDLNECAYADCEQECKNTVGSYYCYCNSGYTLNSNEESCDGKLFIVMLCSYTYSS